MGKYINSELHNHFSNWHWKHNDEKVGGLLPNCWLSDIDRIWVEMRYGKPVCVWDLKTNNELENYNYSSTERNLYKWFLEKEVPVYTVTPIDYSSDEGIKFFTGWKIKKFGESNIQSMTCEQFCAWVRNFKTD